MGVFDKIKSTVLTEYKADTKDMRAGLKKLSGEELKRHKALIEQTDKQNEKLDGQIAMWGKVAVGVGLAAGAVAIAAKGFETYQHNSKLAAATVGVDLKKLQTASNGLVESTRLLEFASSAMNGTFKLSQKEMEGVLKGALALRHNGEDLEKVLQNLEKAVKEGTTEPLKELGLVIKGAPNDTQEGLNAALEALNAEAAKLGGKDGLAGDDISQGIVKGKDAMDRLSESIGRVAAEFGPAITAAAEFLDYLSRIPSKLDRAFGVDGEYATTGTAEAVTFKRNKLNKKLANPDLLPFERKILEKNLRLLDAQFPDLVPQMGPEFVPPAPISPAKTGASPEGVGGKRKGTRVKVPGGMSLDEIMASTYAGSNPQLSNQFNPRQGLDDNAAGAYDGLMGMSEQWAKWDAQKDQKRAKEDNMLSDMFGTPSDIDAHAAALQGLAMTFDGFTGAFGSGIDALITGSDSFANAFKTAIAESLRSMAVEMSISALKHTAYGLASLAFYDGRGAAAHFAAAGAFAGGALAAGVGANALGAGQSQAPAPRTAGSAGVGASGGGSGDIGGTGSTQVFIVGNDFAGLPARQRESQWRQISRSAGVTIEGDVVLDG